LFVLTFVYLACSLPGLANPVATVNGFVQLPENNYTALLNAVATVGPIAISVVRHSNLTCELAF
jgi:hypothetical protein